MKKSIFIMYSLILYSVSMFSMEVHTQSPSLKSLINAISQGNRNLVFDLVMGESKLSKKELNAAFEYNMDLLNQKSGLVFRIYMKIKPKHWTPLIPENISEKKRLKLIEKSNQLEREVSDHTAIEQILLKGIKRAEGEETDIEMEEKE